MARLIHRPSDVRMLLTIGLNIANDPAARVGPAYGSPDSSETSTASPLAQAAVDSSETSMIDGSPVRSRAKSAPAIPPAIVMPPMESPNAGAGMPSTTLASVGVTPTAPPPRDQNALESKPPFAASGPRA